MELCERWGSFFNYWTVWCLLPVPPNPHVPCPQVPVTLSLAEYMQAEELEQITGRPVQKDDHNHIKLEELDFGSLGTHVTGRDCVGGYGMVQGVCLSVCGWIVGCISGLVGGWDIYPIPSLSLTAQ